MAGKGLEGFLASADNLPLAPSAAVSKQSVIKRLLASSPIVTFAIARLWSRASNTAKECVVSRALKSAQIDLKRKRQRPKDLPGDVPCDKMRELSLLLAMGFVYQGSGIFFSGEGYLLFPHDSKGLEYVDRRRCFGVLAYSDVMHVFADHCDLRWVARPINDLINRYIQAHPKAALYVHLVYRGIPPNLDEGLGDGWPLLAVPSVIAEWHEEARLDPDPGKDPDLHFDRVRFFIPYTTAGEKTIHIKKHSSWSEWLVTCVLINTTVTNLNASALPPTRYPCLDKSWPRWGPRQARTKGIENGLDAPNGNAADQLIQAGSQDQDLQAAGDTSARGSTHGYPDPDRSGKKVRVIRGNSSNPNAPPKGPAGAIGRTLLANAQASKRKIMANQLAIPCLDLTQSDAEYIDGGIRLLGGEPDWSMPGEADQTTST